MCQQYVDLARGVRAPGAADEDLPGCLACAGLGDQRAFGDLYDTTVGQVHRLAVLLADGDAQRASELVRRTYGEVWRRASAYRESDGRPLTWVLGLTRSVAHAA